jgi:AraC-like DNA-binding protein/mannose-6-phosphate isomerase-like protein (cupin superfamily)
MKHVNPDVHENSIQELMSPDLQFAFQIVSAHKRQVNGQWSYPEHRHSMFEINMVLEGEQSIHAENGVFQLRTGEMLFIPPGVAHASLGSPSKQPMTYFCLHFDIDDLTLRRSLMGIQTKLLSALDSAAAAAIKHTLDSLIVSLAYGQTGLYKDKLAFLTEAFRLLSALTVWAMDNEADGLQESKGSENDIALASAIERELRAGAAVDRVAQERINVEKMAAKLGYSPAYCKRIFQRVYGMPPRQYLSGLIIRQAKLLLIDTELTVQDIAYRLGYSDSSQFSKQFKRWMNLSPAAFRKITSAHPSSE